MDGTVAGRAERLVLRHVAVVPSAVDVVGLGGEVAAGDAAVVGHVEHEGACPLPLATVSAVAAAPESTTSLIEAGTG